MLSFFKKKTPTYPATSNWSIHQGRHNGLPMIIRRNDAAKLLARHPDYNHRVGIAVPLLNADPNGLPAPEEALQLNAIEDLLSERLESNQDYILVLSISTGSMREFVLYTRNPNGFKSLFEALRLEVLSHQLQCYVSPDLKWDLFYQFA